MTFPARSSIITGVALTTSLMFTAAAAAQAHPSSVAPDSLRRIQEIDPRAGPPGTEVSIYTENVPPQGRVVVGVGRIGAGFEALGEGQQRELGEIGASIVIPETSSWDKPLVILIFNGNFAPTAISLPFHVTDAEGMIRRSGMITDEGEGCLGFRDLDGYFYTLSGDLGGASVGDEIVVDGRFHATGTCSQGETIEVVRVGG